MVQEIQDVTTISGTKVGGLPPHPGQEREARAAGDTGQQRRPSQDSWGRPRAPRGLLRTHLSPRRPAVRDIRVLCCSKAPRIPFLQATSWVAVMSSLCNGGSAIMPHTGFVCFFVFTTTKPKGNLNNQLVHLVHRRGDQEHD